MFNKKEECVVLYMKGKIFDQNLTASLIKKKIKKLELITDNFSVHDVS